MQASTANNETRLPRAVVRQVAKINALQVPIEPKTDPAADTPPVIPSVEAAPTADTQTPPPASPPTDPRHSDPAYWKHRFEVVNGILTKERASRASEVEPLHQRIVELQGDIRTLRESTPSAKPDLSKYLSTEQVEEFGEDQANVIVSTAEKIAREQVQTAIEQQLKPIKDKQERADKRQTEDAQAQFYGTLDELAPDWRAVDTTDEWHAWLAETDEASGLERQDILNNHAKRGNAAAIAAMFKTYKTATNPAVPQPLVAPRGSGAGPSGDPPAGNPGLTALTKAEINGFYKRAALGKVSDQERVTFEARLKLRAG